MCLKYMSYNAFGDSIAYLTVNSACLMTDSLWQGGKLVISSAKHGDRGTYMCRAVNEVGEIVRRIFLEVQCKQKPSILRGNEANQNNNMLVSQADF